MGLRYMDWTYKVDLIGFKQVGWSISWVGPKVNELNLGNGLGPNRLGWA